MEGEPEAEPRPGRDGPPAGSRPAAWDDPVRRSGLIPRGLLDERAVFVVKRLQKEGHEAYLVGGCVRDLIAGLEPKDFDVATDARPNRIKRLFRSARVIGRRFRLVHIRFPGDHVVETATFRGDPSDHVAQADEAPADRPPRSRRTWRDSAENVFGTAPEDALRRDFTVNALFYDPVRDEVIDWVGGLDDMERGRIRSIGEPAVRLREDPVRMLRAVHFAERMDFEVDGALEEAIRAQAPTLAEASQARLYVELIKMLTRGSARSTFHRLHDLGLLAVWLPELTGFLEEPIDWPEAGGGTHLEASRGEPVDTPPSHAAWNLLAAADRWGLAAHEAPESLALAVLFGPWVMTTWRRSRRRGFAMFTEHVELVFRPVALRMSVPRWAGAQMRDMLWMLDELRDPPPARRCRRLVHRPAFPLALALLELDLMARDRSSEQLEFWQDLAARQGVDVGLTARPAARPRPAAGRRRRTRGGRGRRRRTRQRPATPAPEAGAWFDPPPE